MWHGHKAESIQLTMFYHFTLFFSLLGAYLLQFMTAPTSPHYFRAGQRRTFVWVLPTPNYTTLHYYTMYQNSDCQTNEQSPGFHQLQRHWFSHTVKAMPKSHINLLVKLLKVKVMIYGVAWNEAVQILNTFCIFASVLMEKTCFGTLFWICENLIYKNRKYVLAGDQTHKPT